MLRVWPLLIVVLMLAACSSAPTHRDSGSAISTPHAWKPPADLPAFIDHSVGEEEVSIQAMGLVGVPYRWGGNTPDAGFDCSGLVRYVVARAARVDLPRTTAEMSLVGNSIQPDEVAPGDLIFFNTTGRPHSHVGIYVGGYRFVNAPSTGGTVRIDYISNPYWAKRFDGIRRVAGSNRPAGPFDTPQLITSANPETSGPAPKSIPIPIPTPVTTAPAPAIAMEQRPVTEPAAVTAARQPVAAETRRATAEPAADAFEPPPPSREAAQSQAVQEHATPVDPIAAFAGAASQAPVSDRPSGTRTETGTEVRYAQPAPTAAPAVSPAANDDPIARFANGG